MLTQRPGYKAVKLGTGLAKSSVFNLLQYIETDSEHLTSSDNEFHTIGAEFAKIWQCCYVFNLLSYLLNNLIK